MENQIKEKTKSNRKTIKVILKAFDGEMEMKSKLIDLPYDTLPEIILPLSMRDEYPRVYNCYNLKDLYSPMLFCTFKWDGKYYEYRKGKFARVYYLREVENI